MKNVLEDFANFTGIHLCQGLIFSKVAGRERERERDRQTDRQTGRQTDRQKDRQTDRHRDRDRERQRETERESFSGMLILISTFVFSYFKPKFLGY